MKERLSVIAAVIVFVALVVVYIVVVVVAVVYVVTVAVALREKCQTIFFFIDSVEN